MAQKEPIHKIKLGRIRAAVWLNETEKGDRWYRVIITRAWKNGNEWQETTSFDRDDLPVVTEAARMAHSWIWSQQASGNPSSGKASR